MELFLLLSIGMSIVALIPVALSQPLLTSSQINHNHPDLLLLPGIESTFPREAILLASDQVNFLKLEDQAIPIEFEIEGQARISDSQVIESSAELLFPHPAS